MKFESYIAFFIQCYLSPVLLAIYLLPGKDILKVFEINIFETQCAGYRIYTLPYIIVAPVFYFIWLYTSYLFFVQFYPALNSTDLLSIDYSLPEYLCFFITAIYLGILSTETGLSRNWAELVFIHSPVTTACILTYILSHLWWVYTRVLT